VKLTDLLFLPVSFSFFFFLRNQRFMTRIVHGNFDPALYAFIYGTLHRIDDNKHAGN